MIINIAITSRNIIHHAFFFTESSHDVMKTNTRNANVINKNHKTR
ncbi:MAG: hypothetical protein WCG25_04990 [bacterium]